MLHWWATPWRAVQEAAWRALSTPFARDYSVIDDSPQAGGHAGYAGVALLGFRHRIGRLSLFGHEPHHPVVPAANGSAATKPRSNGWLARAVWGTRVAGARINPLSLEIHSDDWTVTQGITPRPGIGSFRLGTVKVALVIKKIGIGITGIGAS